VEQENFHQSDEERLERAMADFVAARGPVPVPPAAGPRARLEARLASAASTHSNRWIAWPALAAASLTILLIAWQRSHHAVLAVPRSNLTPGAVLPLTRDQVCQVELANNRPVPISTRHSVFKTYGISDSDARAYEVDYLITPALGGSDDIHNLWPQPYSSTVWNAHVKDQLEEHLRGLVCAGNVELATAQREISQDWIGAYKKYFHTDRPIPQGVY